MAWLQSPVTARLRDTNGTKNVEINNTKNINTFESDLFEGELLACIKGVRGEGNPFEELYAGDKRILSIVISGKFKKELSCESVTCGMQFQEPLQNLPWGVILTPIEKIITALSPGSVCDLQGTKPRLMNLLVTGADVVHSSPQKINILTQPLQENSSFGGTVPSDRMRLTKQQLSEHTFKTSLYYAFEFWSDKIDLESFCCIIPGIPRIRLAQYLGVQAYPVVAVDSNGCPLWDICINNSVQFGGVEDPKLEYKSTISDTPADISDTPADISDTPTEVIAPTGSVVSGRRRSVVPPGRPSPPRKNTSVGVPPTMGIVSFTIFLLLLWASSSGRLSVSLPNCFGMSPDGVKLIDSVACLGLASAIGYAIA